MLPVKQPIKTLWAGLGSGRMQCYKLDVGRNRHDGVTLTPSKLPRQPAHLAPFPAAT